MTTALRKCVALVGIFIVYPCLSCFTQERICPTEAESAGREALLGAEGYSDKIFRLLAIHWDQLNILRSRTGRASTGDSIPAGRRFCGATQ
jgi:hypothetical protein